MLQHKCAKQPKYYIVSQLKASDSITVQENLHVNQKMLLKSQKNLQKEAC